MLLGKITFWRKIKCFWGFHCWLKQSDNEKLLHCMFCPKTLDLAVKELVKQGKAMRP